MKIIDISWPISQEMTGYKDTKPCTIKQVKEFAVDKARESRICLSAHAGTHVDAPAHFVESGDTIDQIDLTKLIGQCRVLDFTHIEHSIHADDMRMTTIDRGDIVLLKTKNSQLASTASFNYDFVYLTESGARYLVECGVKSVGIDYLGIERSQPNHSTHTVLFAHHVPIIEGLRLAHVQAGVYQLYCLPLVLIGIEAAPARAILMC